MAVNGHYDTMSLSDIKALPVSQIAAKDCCLFMWAVSPQLPEAIEVMTAWGFTYKTVPFVWSKTSKHGNLVWNTGRWTMGNVEICLLGTRGKPNKLRKTYNVRQLVTSVRTRHSAKPPEVRDRIVSLLGDIPRIELFAREQVARWDRWGLEA